MQREIWARGFMDYDIETKGESSQWVGKRFPCPPPKKKTRQSRSNVLRFIVS